MPETIEPVVSQVDPYGDGVRETHPAFAVATVTRSSGTSRTLFQSDLRHQETITLRVHRAMRIRHLNRDWTHPRGELLEIEMSLAQWGALASSIGIGSGVPVTLRHTEGHKDVPELPYEPRIAASVDETKNAVNKLLLKARATFADLEATFVAKKGVRAMREALRNHGNALANAESNAGFAVTSLTEAVEHTVAQARADIEAHVLRAALQTGLESPVSLPQLTTAPGDHETD